jgi:hypothetical protein
VTNYVLGKQSRKPLLMELGNPAFGWSIESSGFGAGIEYTCAHKNHQDVDEDHWITEPCEHCGADILAVDFEEPEFDDLLLWDTGKIYPISAGYYVIHPCGHTMRGIDVAKRRS